MKLFEKFNAGVRQRRLRHMKKKIPAFLFFFFYMLHHCDYNKIVILSQTLLTTTTSSWHFTIHSSPFRLWCMLAGRLLFIKVSPQKRVCVSASFFFSASVRVLLCSLFSLFYKIQKIKRNTKESRDIRKSHKVEFNERYVGEKECVRVMLLKIKVETFH